MQGIVIFFIIFVFLVLIANAVVLILRSRNNKSPYGRRGKTAPLEENASIIRDREVQRRIYLEQEQIIKYLELRSKTWELYEEVRNRHKNESESS